MTFNTKPTNYSTESTLQDLLTELLLKAKLTDVQPVSIDKNSFDAGGALPVANKTTLGAYLMDSSNIVTQLSREGTGSQTYSNGISTMSVTAGQYAVCQSKQIHPYLTGKAQECEITCTKFDLETNVVKKIGLFTSDRVSPYNTNYDGFYFEADGVNNVYNLVIANGNTGIEAKIPSSSWDNSNITPFSSGFFTIFKIDFLYLGGSQIRFWVYGDNGFELLHTYRHAGYKAGTVVKSPNLPVRWEIRSTTGSSSLGQICATVTTGGSLNKVGRQLSPPISTNQVNANTIGTTYLLKAIRLSNTTGLNKTIIDSLITALSSTGDDIWIDVRFNPTIAGAALTFNDVLDENGTATGLQYANADTSNNPSQNTVTGGTVIYGDFISASSRSMSSFTNVDLVRKVGFTLDGTCDILALCATPLITGTNADLHGNFTVLIN
jgi:hypothetical protein